MADGGNVVLFYLFSFFPGLTSIDGQDLIQLSSVVDVVPRNDHHNVIERSLLSPVKWMEVVELIVRDVRKRIYPLLMRQLKPGYHVTHV